MGVFDLAKLLAWSLGGVLYHWIIRADAPFIFLNYAEVQ